MIRRNTHTPQNTQRRHRIDGRNQTPKQQTVQQGYRLRHSHLGGIMDHVPGQDGGEKGAENGKHDDWV